MSGGFFDYSQYHIDEMADTLERYLNKINSNEEKQFSDETIRVLELIVLHLRLSGMYAQRADWLISGDDGEETFHSRLIEEQNELFLKYKDRFPEEFK